MITLTPDPIDTPASFQPEPCCFCGKGARTWYAPKDVAVCTGCARTRSPEEVPTKREWGAAVDAANAARRAPGPRTAGTTA